MPAWQTESVRPPSLRGFGEIATGVTSVNQRDLRSDHHLSLSPLLQAWVRTVFYLSPITAQLIFSELLNPQTLLSPSNPEVFLPTFDPTLRRNLPWLARLRTMSDPQDKPWSDNPNAPKIPYDLYFGEKATFAGILIGSMFYGTCKTLPPTRRFVCAHIAYSVDFRDRHRAILPLYGGAP